MGGVCALVNLYCLYLVLCICMLLVNGKATQLKVNLVNDHYQLELCRARAHIYTPPASVLTRTHGRDMLMYDV